MTVGPAGVDDDQKESVGEAAHICAASPGGARFDAQQTPSQRGSIANGIHLCRNCHGTINQNGGRAYSVDLLLKWKKDAEARARQEFVAAGGASPIPVAEEFSYVSYVNVPRLCWCASELGLDVSSIIDERFYWLSSYGQQTARIAAAFQGLLQRKAVNAVKLSSTTQTVDSMRERTVVFEAAFRSKNPYTGHRTEREPFPRLTGNFLTDPCLEGHDSHRKLIIPYDPRWITTSTAFSDFQPRSGWTKLRGLGTVKGVEDGKSITNSPMVMGLPKSKTKPFSAVEQQRLMSQLRALWSSNSD